MKAAVLLDKCQSREESRPKEPKAHSPLPARGLGTLRPPALQRPLRRRHRRSWPQLRGEEWRPYLQNGRSHARHLVPSVARPPLVPPVEPLRHRRTQAPRCGIRGGANIGTPHWASPRWRAE